ncbi:hypothetical protein GIB67_023998 [Kingdonia uniflora]|uniref:Uncharacterized protein n=1 Tax=Kingdonia uniflora TaxID=39325 RepID=A0A7J7LEC0_9MAGN|nr:hypothetical protein GIB67_023998 [Kingdonia uniflora]
MMMLSHDPGGSRRNWSFYQSRLNEVESRSNDLNPWAKVSGEVFGRSNDLWVCSNDYRNSNSSLRVLNTF